MIDFDAAIRDPANPRAMLPIYDSGDTLHPNSAGYAAMANAIDLDALQHDEADAATASSDRQRGDSQ